MNFPLIRRPSISINKTEVGLNLKYEMKANTCTQFNVKQGEMRKNYKSSKLLHPFCYKIFYQIQQVLGSQVAKIFIWQPLRKGDNLLSIMRRQTRMAATGNYKEQRGYYKLVRNNFEEVLSSYVHAPMLKVSIWPSWG